MLIRILLCQKRTLWRTALANLLSQEEDLRVVAERSKGEEVLFTTISERPNIVVLDANLPGGPPVDELCKSLRAKAPACGVLILLERQAPAGRAIAALGPRVGLIGTDTSPERLIAGIRELAGGQPVIDPDLVLAMLSARDNPLTDREREVLFMASRGAPTREIAAHLFLSAGTVRNYLSRALSKTGARTRIEAVRIAQDAGWI
ncbi:response regulator transcription factor [Phytomonospora sp. NPDC050363]|uniref:response regulator transcription factor n=1 Tax=Phytomonospora sp. NPDC050363 TaxID=3155642 RepID=UPI0033C2D252